MNTFYRHPLPLLTDLYELTMAQGYWKRGMAEDDAVFHLFFRRPPYRGGFTIAAGLSSVIDFLETFRYDQSDLHYLASLKGSSGDPLFEDDFLHYLSHLQFSCDIDAVNEGDIIFPYEPLIRVSGPLIQAQLLESALLTLTNFPTLIATKAARLCFAAQGEPVIEFGLRRAQGIDGALTASRAAYVGGCSATSNVLAGKLFGIPVLGTMAHSWIMAFESEMESFQAFAEALPQNCIFLVDTYDSIQGVKNAIEVGKWLKERGKPFLGIRLDSGDLAYLSIESRKLLDAAGFKDAIILASNELDERLIADLKTQGAKIAMWGVGTHLVTGQSHPALDGVYKLSALRKKGEKEWHYKLKLSEQMTKVSNPGILQVRRFSKEGFYFADAICDYHEDLSQGATLVDPFDPSKKMKISKKSEGRELLNPIFRGGKLVYSRVSLPAIQSYVKEELSKFDRSIKRFNNPNLYPVMMEESLYRLKTSLVEKIREQLDLI